MCLDVDLIDEIALAFVEAALQSPEYSPFTGTAHGMGRSSHDASVPSKMNMSAEKNKNQLSEKGTRNGK